MIDSRGDKKLPTPSVEFDAIIGRSELKEALLSVAADDSLSGLLVQGEKGTAKSTAVRGLVELLPDQRAVADCPFGCSPGDPERQCMACREREDLPVETRSVPLVTLPLGATRERLVGGLSVADALSGEPEFDPGLLARANRGILYVDEVNLLEDHLVDTLLDAAASGVNRVERDGVSLAHPAEFTLIGTMNPEEGDLRPQLRDRFALRASVEGSDDVAERVTIIDRALGKGEERPESDGNSRERLLTARERLSDVVLSADHKRGIAELCRDAGVDGHRADIATARAARTLAALDDRSRVLESDVRRAAELALPHRLQSCPFEDTPEPEEMFDEHFGDESTDDEQEGRSNENDRIGSGNEADGGGDGEAGETPENDGGGLDGDREPTGDEGAGSSGGGSGTERGTEDDSSQPEPANAEEGSDDEDQPDEEAMPLLPGQNRVEIGEAAAPTIEPDADANDESTGGSRASATTTAGEGPRVRDERAGPDDPIDAGASVRAAAGRGASTVQSRDLRRSVRAGSASALVVFALDASASMRGPMRAAKGVAMELLKEAYEERDEVSVVSFAGAESEVLVPPTDSVSMAARHLKELPTADRTPLSAGLRSAGEVIDRADPAVGVVVLVTDGRANAGDSPTADTHRAARQLAELDAHVVVVDAGEPNDRTTLTAEIVRATGGEHVPLAALSAERVEDAVARARHQP